jgi:hypothetical protein
VRNEIRKMRTEEEIQAVFDRLYTLVDTGDETATVIYDTLQWVVGDSDTDPYAMHIGDEEGDD